MTEGSLFSVECVALHTAAEVFYVMRLGGEVSETLNYPDVTGAPSLTSPIFKSELSVCYVWTQSLNLTKSNDGFLTVLREFCLLIALQFMLLITSELGFYGDFITPGQLPSVDIPF